MSVRVVIVENPFDPREWEDNLVDDAREFLLNRFSSWPEGARIYDLEGFEALDRAAGALMTSVLASRDVTPVDEPGIERLGELRGPLLVAVSPADPLTAIIAVVAVVVAIAASLLLMPKIPDVSNVYQSPNNTLTDRLNTARPNGRIPDIFGSVRSTPDLLTVPYRRFENNLELEVAFMCVGRGAYDLSDIRDGDTPYASISGASAAFYAPGDSPNLGSVPQLLIGDAMTERVSSIVAVNGVNGQVLKPPNNNGFRADGAIKFVAPDTIVLTDGSTDFTTQFFPGDDLTVGGADFGDGLPTYDATSQSARFYPDKRIEFETFNPSTLYRAGQTLQIVNGGFVGVDSLGDPVFIDVSGYEVIDTLNSTTIQLV